MVKRLFLPGVLVVSLVAVGLGLATAHAALAFYNPPDWDRSSIEVHDCDGGCDVSTLSFEVCNVGDGNMAGTTPWSLYYAASGNPFEGAQIDSGTVGPLDSGECTDVVVSASMGAGNYGLVVAQRPGHPGKGEARGDCSVNVCEVPTHTPTPSKTPTATSTPTEGPSPTPTDTPTVTNTPTKGPSPTPTDTGQPGPTSTKEPPSNTGGGGGGPYDSPGNPGLMAALSLAFGVVVVLSALAVYQYRRKSQ